MIDLNDAAKNILENGYVILDDLVSHEHLDILFDVMLPRTVEMIEKKKWGGLGSSYGHLQQNPPRYAPYVYSDIVTNNTVIEISARILGEGFYNNLYTSNTNCPNSTPQLVHPDWVPLWPFHPIPHPTVSLVVNIPLVDVTEENGSMEIWPKTHLIQPSYKIVTENELEQQRSICPPLRINMKKGSILIRDMRAWHRGMPNFSNVPRHMLSMTHYINWLQRDKPTTFDIKCKDILTHQKIQFNANFSEDVIDDDFDPTDGKYQIDLSRLKGERLLPN